MVLLSLNLHSNRRIHDQVASMVGSHHHILKIQLIFNCWSSYRRSLGSLIFYSFINKKFRLMPMGRWVIVMKMLKRRRVSRVFEEPYFCFVWVIDCSSKISGWVEQISVWKRERERERERERQCYKTFKFSCVWK